MKKHLLVALALTAVLCLALCAAALASPIDNAMPKDVTQVTLHRGESAVVLTSKVNSGSGAVTLEVRDVTHDKVVKTESVKAAVGQTVKWSIAFDETLPTAQVNIEHYVMDVSMDGKHYTWSLYLTYNAKEDTITVESGTWYSDNTACVQGLPLRDMNRPITSKWYHVLPVDLSVQGTQEFNYIASNIYIIGKVYVTVSGDNVTVTYHNYYDGYGGNTTTLSEYVNVFHNLGELTDADPKNNPSSYAFGQSFTISGDLGGDTNVVLYIVNHVTYCDYVTGTHKLTRYWPNLKEHIAYRESLEHLMEADDDSGLTTGTPVVTAAPGAGGNG